VNEEETTEMLIYILYVYIYILQFNVYNIILYNLFVYNIILLINMYILSNEGRLIIYN